MRSCMIVFCLFFSRVALASAAEGPDALAVEAGHDLQAPVAQQPKPVDQEPYAPNTALGLSLFSTLGGLAAGAGLFATGVATGSFGVRYTELGLGLVSLSVGPSLRTPDLRPLEGGWPEP